MWLKKFLDRTEMKIYAKPQKTIIGKRSGNASPCRVTAVVSGKGGVGKTFVSCVTSSLLASSKKKVLLMDLDAGLRNMDLMMGVENKSPGNLFDVLSGSMSWESATFEDDRIDGLLYLIADQARGQTSIDANQFKNLVNNLRDYFDNIIIDVPAGINEGYEIGVNASDDVVLVTTSETPTVRSAAQICSMLEHYGNKSISIIVNKVIHEIIGSGGFSPEEVALMTGTPVRASIPFDINVMIASHQGIPLVCWPETSEALKAMKVYMEKDFLLPVAI